MVTMKDVAKLAGVSHGTVSNVVNGVKNVSVDKIKKVEEAMAALGYKPNSAARNLKMEYTNQIDLVVPNMFSAEFPELYEAVRNEAEKSNYTLNLKVSDGIADKECKILNESIMNNVDGVILVTCQPANLEFFSDIVKKGLKIVFCIADLAGSDCNFIGFDISDIMEHLIGHYREQGKRIALVTEDAQSSYHDQLINTYCKGMLQDNQTEHQKYMEIIQVNTGYEAKGAARLFQLSPRPDVVIVSNETVAREIHRFQYILEGEDRHNMKVIIFNQGKKTPFFEDIIIPLPFKTVGRHAFETMVRVIEQESGHGNYRSLVRTLPEEVREPLLQKISRGKKLKVLLNESPSSDAVKALLPNFTRRTGIEVEIVTKKISGMFQTIMEDQQQREFDIYSIDVPWMDELARNKVIACLDDFVQQNARCTERYSEPVLNAFSKVNGHVYGIPYVFSAQLLFYRKDLFDKIKNQRLYYEWYKEDLRVPRTWDEFNKVARLFTRKYNPDSETKYGITLGGSAYSGAICEYLPRLWSMGGSIFEDGKIIKNEDSAMRALENYIEGFGYADAKSVNWWWDEQVNEFIRGKAAMMMMFSEHASALAEKKHSKIAGKYQVAVLPGKTSVMGGWSLAVRNTSESRTEAYEFLKWISDGDLLEENAVLGRVSPDFNAESREILDGVYRWFGTAVEGFESAKARCIPENIQRYHLSEIMVETLIGNRVHNAVLGKEDAKSAIRNLRMDLKNSILNDTK